MYLKSEFRTGFRTFWEDELVRPSSFGGRVCWSVIERTSGWKKGSLLLGGSADQCLVPYGIVRALPHTVATAHWVWWGKAAWDALWEFWLRPGQSTVGPSVFKCQRRHLGGQLVRQELGIRLKELRWVSLSLSLSGVFLRITPFPEIQWKDTTFESGCGHPMCSAPVPQLPPCPRFAVRQVGIAVGSGLFELAFSHIYLQTETTNFSVELAL